jgi:hypothetical protein
LTRGDKGFKKMNSTLSTPVAAEKGKPITIALKWAGNSANAGSKVLARVGIEPTGSRDSRSNRINWSDWQTLKPFHNKAQAATVAENSLVRLFAQCRTEGDLKEGMAVFVLDAVEVVASK